MKNKRQLLSFLAALILAASLMVFSACTPGGTNDPENSTDAPETTVDLSKLLGQSVNITADELGATPHSAASADPTIVEAHVMDREVILTATGAGATEVTVKNTYGEEFTLHVVCDPEAGISHSGGYTRPENSINIKELDLPSGTSDSERLQKAIDSLQSGGTVYIPRGVYLISLIQLREGVDLRLEGVLNDYTKDYAASGAQNAVNRGSLAILRTDGGGDMFVNHAGHDYGRNGCSDFEITGGMLDMQGKNRCFIWCCADNVLLKNVILKDCPNNHAIQVTGSTNVTITECMFAGYNYQKDNSNAEVIQIEQSHPGAIGGGSNPMSKFDAGEYYASANVEVSYCYFGKSDKYDAPTYAIGHHGQVHKSAVTGCKIVGNVFDNCRCSAIRYPAYSSVEISGNRFVSNRDNCLSPDAMPAMISLVLRNSDVTIEAQNAAGSKVTAYYAQKFACQGSIGTVIENNEFEFGAASAMRYAVSAVSNSYTFDATYDSGHMYTNWYTEPAKYYRGYLVVANRIEDLCVRGNSIKVADGFGGKGTYFAFNYVVGLLCENNTVEGGAESSGTTVDGVFIPNARAAGCTYMTNYKRKYTVTVSRSCPANVRLEGEGGMTLKYTGASDGTLKLKAEGGILEMTVNASGDLVLTPVADEGKTFAGYEVTTGKLTEKSGKQEYSTSLTIVAKFN